MPVTSFDVKEKYRYQTGFNSYLESEAVPGALPIGQNSPQKPAFGLYAEKLSGTAFTAPRHENKQTWLYRILPSCAHPPFAAAAHGGDGADGGEHAPQPVLGGAPDAKLHFIPNQLRWSPFDHDDGDDNNHSSSNNNNNSSNGGNSNGGKGKREASDFVRGLRLVGGAGDATLKQGLGVYVYAAGRSMDAREAFYSADGDLLVVPQEGALDIRTELGWLLVRPMEVCVIPRGVRYQVLLAGGGGHDDDNKKNDHNGDGDGVQEKKVRARGYALELYQGHFALPELGPIGSNGLANARDFQAPLACFSDEHVGETAFTAENGGAALASASVSGRAERAPNGGSNGSSSSTTTTTTTTFTLTAKFGGRLYCTRQPHTPFDVVAWHGNYFPVKYDLGRFNTIGSISYDHPDPSIFTVLTAQSERVGTAVADFVVFPPRWLVGEDTFRPPWFHRNTMSEFMGLIRGTYDAKKAGGGGGGGHGGGGHDSDHKSNGANSSNDDDGFAPGGASLHNVMSGHGPDADAYEKARAAELRPAKVGADDGGCAFVFESCLMLGVTDWALARSDKVQTGYSAESWGPLRVHWRRPEGAPSGTAHLLGR